MKENHKKLRYKYDEVHPFKEGMAAVKRSWRSGYLQWGFIDDNGDEVIPCQYQKVLDFHEGLAAVNNGCWGYIDKDGNEIIPCIFDGDMNHESGNFSEGIAKVSWHMYDVGYENGQYQCSYLNKNGEFITPSRFNNGSDFHEGLVAVQSLKKRRWNANYVEDGTGLWGYLNKNGDFAIPFTFDNASDFHEGLAAVQYGNKDQYDPYHHLWGVINENGEFVVPYKYKAICDFHNGLAAVQSNNNNLWGYINTSGEEVIPCQFREVRDFHEGIAAVQGTFKLRFERYYSYPWWLINTNGFSISRECFPAAYDFSDGYSQVLRSAHYYEPDLYTFIDKNGNYGRCWHSIESFRDGMAIVGLNEGSRGKYSYTVVNTDFEPISPKIDFDFPCHFMYLTDGVLLYRGEDGYYRIYHCDVKEKVDDNKLLERNHKILVRDYKIC